MIFFKGLVNKDKIKKMFLYSILIFLILEIVLVYKNKLDIKIYERENQVAFRTVTVDADDMENLLEKYESVIEDYEITEDGYDIIFKTKNDLENFKEKEDYDDHLKLLVIHFGEVDEFEQILFVTVNIIVIVLSILVVLLVFIFSLNYLNQVLDEWRLYVILGYKKKTIARFYFLFLIVFFTSIYVGVHLVFNLFFSGEIMFSKIMLVLIILAIAVTILIAEKSIYKS